MMAVNTRDRLPFPIRKFLAMARKDTPGIYQTGQEHNHYSCHNVDPSIQMLHCDFPSTFQNIDSFIFIYNCKLFSGFFTIFLYVFIKILQ